MARYQCEKGQLSMDKRDGCIWWSNDLFQSSVVLQYSSTDSSQIRPSPDARSQFPSKQFWFPILSTNKKEIQTDVPGRLEVAGGLNFVNDEDSFPPLEKHDPIVNNIMDEYLKLQHLKIIPCWIDSGLNILQRQTPIPYCRHICIQKSTD